MVCQSCNTENPDGAKFCNSCGAPLLRACASCGTGNAPGARFCSECGAALGDAAAAAATAPAPALREAPASERRLVSVLFADLVGFTTLSESRDAEEVRELLSRYFDTCKRLITLYGGTVEKFIGDAVMAVWGTPTATEDDAERAVRAALDLVTAVKAFGDELGAPGLSARASVLTGEAAVTIGAEGEGMVAGDLVNTASRVQSAADPGTVLVGEATKRSTEAAIAYEAAGVHELKGKSESIPLWRALRVTARVGGVLKAEGLEPPFVGRARELRVVKELFHGSGEERRAHLVSVIGIAGIGKSRLVWEFRKYIDGLVDTIWWHRGRCLAYGEGVAYWALAEMVRMRADIVEGEEPSAARAKLRAAVEVHVPDAEERSWIEPRLAHLLGLEELLVHEREDLFAGWRLFFERMAEQQPVIMVFEDMQWADVSLLDFVEYLLEWSRSYPIYVLASGRPELVERHPQWGAGRRTFTSLSLEPLSAEAMDELITGLVPGLPNELRAQILARAEGVPLYAVETVRMLLDRGLLEREGDVYRPAGPIEALDVPVTLHALIAARLDGLEPAERRLVQDAAVLGKTFSKPALAAVSGIPEEDVEPILAALVRKEVLSLQVDARSPERGQYGFLQDLLKRVAYETLARRDRKARHLAAAAHLERAFGTAEQEIVEVVAAHYRDAYEAAPDDEDASAIKAKAREALARAGERAASLAAGEEAQRYFEQAAGLADDTLVEAKLRERAGEMASAAGRPELAQARFERAIELFEEAGETHPAARVSSRVGELEWQRGHLEQALERMERALTVLAADEPDADYAELATQLGRLQFFNGNLDRATELLELGLSLAESLLLPEILAQALNTYGVISTWRSRPETAQALFTHSLKIALEHDLPTPAFRAYNNLADCLFRRDRHEEALPYHTSGIALARKVGNRTWEWTLLMESMYPLMFIGRWNEAMAAYAAVPQDQALGLPVAPTDTLVEIEAARGKFVEARQRLSEIQHLAATADIQQRAMYAVSTAIVLRGEGNHAEALTAALEAIGAIDVLGASHQCVKAGFVEALEASFALSQLDRADELLATIEALRPGDSPPFLRAQRARFQARLAVLRDEPDAAEARLKEALTLFREFGMVFWVAVTQVELGEWLVGQGRAGEAEPLVDEARETFGRLEATPWLERAASAALEPQAAEAVG